MGRRPTKSTIKETVRRATIRDMKRLGVYKPEYSRLIDIYSELVEQYTILTKEFQAGGYQCEVETAQGTAKKSPIVATLEALRKDILAYSDRLCLNPKALENVTADKAGQSKLAAVLSELK